MKNSIQDKYQDLGEAKQWSCREIFEVAGVEGLSTFQDLMNILRTILVRSQDLIDADGGSTLYKLLIFSYL